MKHIGQKRPLASVEAKLYPDGEQVLQVMKTANSRISPEETVEFLQGVVAYIENFIQQNLKKEEG